MAVSNLPALAAENLPITTEPPTHDEVDEAVAAMRTTLDQLKTQHSD